MRTTIVAGLFVVALTGGCGTVLDEPDGVARGTGAAPGATGSSAPPFDREALSARVKKALMAPGAMVGVGVVTKPEDDFDADETTSEYCNLEVLGEGTYNHVAHLRSWRRSPGVNVFETAHGYSDLTGKDAVDKTRQYAQSCTTYVLPHSDVKIELLDEVDLGTVAGVDAWYARCHRRTYGTDPPAIACEAHLGRGTLLADVFVYSGNTVATASAKLRQIVPIAAAALAAA